MRHSSSVCWYDQGTWASQLRDNDHARAVMHAGIANLGFPVKSVAGKTLPVFPANARPTILCIWQEADDDGDIGTKIQCVYTDVPTYKLLFIIWK